MICLDSPIENVADRWISIYFPALRELFRAKLGNFPASNFSSGELIRDIELSQIVKEDIKAQVQSVGETSGSLDCTEEPQTPVRPLNTTRSFVQLNDAADEFFDFPDESEYDQDETMWPSSDAVMHSQVNCLSNSFR